MQAIGNDARRQSFGQELGDSCLGLGELEAPAQAKLDRQVRCGHRRRIFGIGEMFQRLSAKGAMKPASAVQMREKS